MRILVIEDDDYLMEIFLTIFENEGYEVVKACTVLEGTRILNEQNFNIVLCDNRLSDGYGVDIIKAFKPKMKLTKFILSSACYEIASIADCFLPKPFKYGELLEAIRK